MAILIYDHLLNQIDCYFTGICLYITTFMSMYMSKPATYTQHTKHLAQAGPVYIQLK